MPTKYQRLTSPRLNDLELWHYSGRRRSPHGFMVLGAVRFIGDQPAGFEQRRGPYLNSNQAADLAAWETLGAGNWRNDISDDY